MVSVSLIKACSSFFKKGSKLVYSITRTPQQTTTMFDAFCKTMLDSKNIAKLQKRASAQYTATEEQLQQVADRIIANSGANAVAHVRIKSDESSLKKVEKALKEIKKDGYDKARARVHDLLIHDGPVSLVNDGYGIRFAILSNKTGNKKTSDLLFNELTNAHRATDSEVILTEIEDYCGRGINPYAGRANIDNLQNLTYTTPGGRFGTVSAAEKIKDGGYTRTNVSGYVKGIPAEIQIGGEHTIKWGDVEHIIYDARQGKPLNLKDFKTQEQKDLAVKIRTAYDNLMKNEKMHDTYKNNYLNKIWSVLREAEEKNLVTPNYPPLPEGIPEILSVENIMKLAHS